MDGEDSSSESMMETRFFCPWNDTSSSFSGVSASLSFAANRSGSHGLSTIRLVALCLIVLTMSSLSLESMRISDSLSTEAGFGRVSSFAGASWLSFFACEKKSAIVVLG